MRYIKLFEEFVNYKPEVYQKKSMGPISAKRSMGSVNWFTRDEILKIREKGKELGVPYIAEKNKGISLSFFGDESGRGGLKESIMSFFTKGGNLCNEVNITTDISKYKIVKRDNIFYVNNKNTGTNILDSLMFIK